MEPRQQVLAGLALGVMFVAIGLARARTRGRLALDQKIDYGFVLKLIFSSLAFSAAILTLLLTIAFIADWATYVDPPGMPPRPLDAFMPIGFAVHYVMGLVAARALCLLALPLIGYLDHINTG